MSSKIYSNDYDIFHEQEKAVFRFGAKLFQIILLSVTSSFLFQLYCINT